MYVTMVILIVCEIEYNSWLYVGLWLRVPLYAKYVWGDREKAGESDQNLESVEYRDVLSQHRKESIVE